MERCRFSKLSRRFGPINMPMLAIATAPVPTGEQPEFNKGRRGRTFRVYLLCKMQIELAARDDTNFGQNEEHWCPARDSAGKGPVKDWKRSQQP